jgi:hypothetical protein
MPRQHPDPATIPYGHCHCGCGQKTGLARFTAGSRGWVKGQPLRFLKGHGATGRPRKVRPLCGCGCGQRVTSASARFRRGHHLRLAEYARCHPPVRQGSDHPTYKHERWVEEDRGYSSPCWIWQLNHDPVTGYGLVVPPGTTTTTTAHRMQYILTYGPIDSKLHVDHLCEQRLCVNPSHLEAVTPGENIRRATSTLTHADVRYIRASDEAARVMAERFGVSTGSIHDIRARRRWADVA